MTANFEQTICGIFFFKGWEGATGSKMLILSTIIPELYKAKLIKIMGTVMGFTKTL